MCSQHEPAGSPEGRSPFGRGLGVSPSISFYFPLPIRKGARGMVRAHKMSTHKGHPYKCGGVQRGATPLAGSLEGVPPDFQIAFTPALDTLK